MAQLTSPALARLQDLAKFTLESDQAMDGPPQPRPTNTHIHLPPNFSAFHSVEQAVEMAAAQGVCVLGVSNYYDYGIYDEFEEAARRHGIFPLFGIEIIAMDEALRKSGIKVNDPGNPGKSYFCGKGIVRFADADRTPGATALLKRIRQADAARMKVMAGRLGDYLSARGIQIVLSSEEIIARMVEQQGFPRESIVLQERHLAQACQEALFRTYPAEERSDRLRAAGIPVADASTAAMVQNALRTHLLKAGGPAFVQEDYVTLEEARQLVLELGGIPCYPTLADGAEPVTEFEARPETLTDHLRERNVHCVEFIPVRNRPETLLGYVRTLRAAGFVVTAGTEHNTLDTLPMEPACGDGEPIPEEVKRTFWEGACVVAAHQVLAARGETGFVDSDGLPHRGYGNSEERIAAFAAMGSRIIKSLQDSGH